MSTDTLARTPLTVLTEEELAFREAVASFAEQEVRPRVAAMERDAKLDPALVRQYFDMGLMGIEVDEQYGGAGGSLMMVTLAVEEISKVDASSAIMVDVQNTLVEYPIRTYGTEAQKAKYLGMLTSGTVGAYALSEPGSGSDAFGMALRAEKTSAGWELNGSKLWITNGAEAEVFVVFANANPSAGYKGITAFIVEKSFAGFSVGKKEDKMGIRASSTTPLSLDGVVVPEENVLGPVGQGYKIAIDTLNGGRVGIGAQMIGVAGGALRAAIEYTKERKQFGKAIAEFQSVQHQVARAAVDLEAATLTVYNAARLRDAGKPFLTEAAICKIFSSEVAERTASLAVNLFGGNGFVKDYPVEKFYRDAKIGQIYEGTSNLQLQTIAKHLLG